MQAFWKQQFQSLEIKQLIEVFELMPDVLFWIKDIQGRIVYANKVYVEHIGAKSLKEVHGKTDLDFFPPHLAKQYMHDDESLLKGQLVTDRLEMNITQNSQFAWFSTSKRPLKNEQDHIIGSYGITRHFQKSSHALSSIDALKGPIDFIRQNYSRAITSHQLADLCHLSLSALERRFKKYLGKTPTQFINDVRLENARLKVVETTLPISEIAYASGFSDHSYFTKQFKLVFGIHPSQMREQVLRDRRIQ
ncbi:helix-turn-helix domain-containing protein [Neptunicella sp. SCSIO 80796]|uniref:AraC family transcriptional regulator n=1 Tax=Neptunicella plasticusilytica TaxID=3117012 RepID=UPI003A4DA1A0